MDGLAEKNTAVVVCGPTATGKSSLALHLAQRLNGELVGADSMQIYKGLVVGTAALTPAETGGVRQHMVGTVAPENRYSVADWLDGARDAMAAIASEGKLPVVCGGTGLYIKNLVNGTAFTEEPSDGLREKLYDEWDTMGAAGMLERLAGLDPERAATLHLNDKKRILRALEQALRTGKTAAQREEESRQREQAFHYVCIGLDYPDREALYQAINTRVDRMVAANLAEEAEMVWQNRNRYTTAAQAIGYKELFPCFEKTATFESCIEKLKQATRNYAKRQLTWFRKMDGIHWLMADDAELESKARHLVENHLREQEAGRVV